MKGNVFSFPRAQREPPLVYPQGIKGTIFSLSVLDYAKRYCTSTKPPGVLDLYNEVGRYLAVHGLRTGPSGLVRPLPPSSTHLRLVLIPLGSLEVRVSDHQLTTRYLETLEYRH